MRPREGDWQSCGQTAWGDRWSARIDAHFRLITSLVDEESCDITLKEPAAQLAERGHRFSIGSLWRFFDRHDITWKKDRACERTGLGAIAPVLAAVALRPAVASIAV